MEDENVQRMKYMHHRLGMLHLDQLSLWLVQARERHSHAQEREYFASSQEAFLYVHIFRSDAQNE